MAWESYHHKTPSYYVTSLPTIPRGQHFSNLSASALLQELQHLQKHLKGKDTHGDPCFPIQGEGMKIFSLTNHIDSCILSSCQRRNSLIKKKKVEEKTVCLFFPFGFTLDSGRNHYVSYLKLRRWGVRGT